MPISDVIGPAYRLSDLVLASLQQATVGTV